MEKLSQYELRALVEPHINLKGHFCTHVASGKTYIITDVMLREEDLSVEVSYRELRGKAVTFSRPIAAFTTDGRFTIGPHWTSEEEEKT